MCLLSDDDREAASAVLTTAARRTHDLTDELQATANEHFEAAPASSLHVLKLNRAIARAVLDWIDQWPR